VRGDRTLRLSAGAVAPAVWSRLDEAPPSQPVYVMFKSDRARALRDAGTLPLEGPEKVQQLLPAAALWDLLEACAARGLAVDFGRHSATGDGLVVT
jgi:hypothetical protein